ncbi:MAG TPA: flagellar basal body-associated FliL family protein [Opitutaceae bacterium]|jgi:flagellar FliL protein|nr:flagellar basal body-associated FliL family protein [Opitutaceae bacterium]
MADKEKSEKPAPADKEKPAPEKSAPADKEKGGAAEAAAPAGGGKGPLIIAAAAVVLAPVLSLGVAQFVLLPKLEKKLAAPVVAVADAAPAISAEDKKDGKTAAPPTYEFQNVVVNLAGTMGTRYLKTSFIVTGAKDSNLQKVFEDNKAKLTDVTLNVLSSLTLADLEEPGSKNVLREKLVGAYNQALDHKTADQIYFSDFVVQ